MLMSIAGTHSEQMMSARQYFVIKNTQNQETLIAYSTSMSGQSSVTFATERIDIPNCSDGRCLSSQHSSAKIDIKGKDVIYVLVVASIGTNVQFTTLPVNELKEGNEKIELVAGTFQYVMVDASSIQNDVIASFVEHQDNYNKVMPDIQTKVRFSAVLKKNGIPAFDNYDEA